MNRKKYLILYGASSYIICFAVSLLVITLSLTTLISLLIFGLIGTSLLIERKLVVGEKYR